MSKVPGTKGYEKVVNAFAYASLELDFGAVHKELYKLLPSPPARILDVGAGVGQNSATFARLGLEVTAVEPLNEFLTIGKSTFLELEITWLQDSLPKLARFSANTDQFDFILLDGVWHHLNVQERKSTIQRFSELLKPRGKCAITLRNGPAGAGKHTFPTDTKELIEYAEEFGFEVMLKLQSLPSVMKHKPDVLWDKVVIQKLP